MKNRSKFISAGGSGPRLFTKARTSAQCPALRWGLGTVVYGLAVSSVMAAPVLTASSKAHGLSSNLSLGNLALVNPTPAALVQGAAPPAYSQSQTAVPLNVNVSQLLVVDLLKATGVIDTAAASEIGNPGQIRITSASSTVEDLDLAVGGLIGVAPLISIAATAVEGSSTITSNNGQLAAGGVTQLAGLQVRVLGGAPLTLGVGSNPPPNTEIDLSLAGLAGARLVLNEQTVTGAGTGKVKMVGNALSLKLDAVTLGGLGLINGTVEIGHHESEVVVDLDGDGILDETDPDDDGDGLTDVVEGGSGTDSDNDGIVDSRDTDSDNDSIPDSVEGAADPDNDGIPNYRDSDSDGDTISDQAEGTADPDNDTIPNYLDPDSDGDTLADLVEGTGDPDNDDTPNYLDLDSDGDTLADAAEGSTSPDGDGFPNFVDLDSDGDGIADAREGLANPDGDGVPNFLDLESDGDGLNDAGESGSVDANGDGLRDNAADANGDGIADSAASAPALRDSDLDGVPDFLDLDSDNDSLSDLQEGGAPGTDSNDDGILDPVDADGDGITDAADNKAGFGDANDPGPRNTDGTDVPDYVDLDSDNSGSPDIAAAGNTLLDANGDGRIDSAADTDGDGVAQAVDSMLTTPGGLAGLMTFQEWRELQFSPAELQNPSVSGPEADPDGDGVANLLEFTFGTQPENPASLANPAVVASEGPGGRLLEVTVPKASGIYVFVGVEVSTQLEAAGQWAYRPDLVNIASESGTSLVARCQSNPAVNPRFFVRVRSRVP